MRRRKFLIGACAIVAAANAARAQRPSNRPLIAFLDGKSKAAGQGLTSAFQDGLRELGYSENHNIEIAYRFADGRDERLPALALELIRLKPTIIVAPGVNAAVAARNVTKTIPIVSWALADAIELGLVASYARPGGNVTGIMPYVEGLPAKQMQFARQLVPGVRKVGMLGNSNDPKAPPQQHEMELAAATLNINVVVPKLQSPEQLEDAMRLLAAEKVDVVIVLQTGMTLSERQQIAALALRNRVRTIFGYRENVEAGGLMSYGVDLRWCSRRAASYVDKILKGSPAADLPVEFPTTLQLVVNLRTAKALGVTVPATLLAQADEVMQ
jgi:putative ABC transport system substrate-binding protein